LTTCLVPNASRSPDRGRPGIIRTARSGPNCARATNHTRRASLQVKPLSPGLEETWEESARHCRSQALSPQAVLWAPPSSGSHRRRRLLRSRQTTEGAERTARLAGPEQPTRCLGAVPGPHAVLVCCVDCINQGCDQAMIGPVGLTHATAQCDCRVHHPAYLRTTRSVRRTAIRPY
jgi:hypothetical protein